MWGTSRNGKPQPLNADGVVHFATCPKRRGPAPPADVCTRCGSFAVLIGPGAGPHHARLTCQDCRAVRWLRKPEVV
jgi:hypothetical protein